MSPERAVEWRLARWAPLLAREVTVYQLRLPQRPRWPAVLVRLDDHPQGKHLRGPQTTTLAVVTVDCYDAEVSGQDPYARVEAIADDVNEALTLGPFAAGDPASIRVTGCMRTAERAHFEPGELRLARVALEYEVWSRPL